MGAALALAALVVAGILGAVLAGAAVGVPAGELELGDNPDYDRWLHAWALPLQTALILGVVARRLEGVGEGAWRRLGVRGGERLWAVALVVPAGLVADRVVVLLQAAWPGLGFDGLGSLAALPGAGGLLGGLLVLGLVVLGPLGEEVLFRGLVLRGLWSDGSPIRAVAISALLFGLFHLEPVHAAGAAVLGLYLGWLRVITGSLWAPVAAHVLNNGIWYALVVTGRAETGTPLWLDGAALAGVLAVVWITRDGFGEIPG